MRPVGLALVAALVMAAPAQARLPTGVYVGKVGGVAVGVAVDSKRLVAYACDGRRLGRWYEAARPKGNSLRTGAGSNRLVLSARRGALRATLRNRKGTLRRATGRAGLYRSESRARGKRRLAGWVVLRSRRQVGAVQIGANIEPAPALSTTTSLASLSGTSLVAQQLVSPSTSEPLVVDLAGDGFDISRKVTTTLLGGGARSVAWTRAGSDDAFLTLDTARLRSLGYRITTSSGTALTGIILLRAGLAITDPDGTQTTTAGGWQLLRALDADGDGKLRTSDAVFGAIRAFRDANGDGNFGSTELGGSGMLQEMAALNMQFLALQTAVQNETRLFATLSNASKSRHSVVVAIVGLKGA